MISDRDPLRKIPTKHAPEARGDIGGALKAARLKKGHSLEAVSQQTRIPKKYLDALEANRFEEFPALAYLRGFLKNYCDYLELEFEPLWRLATTAPGAAPEETPAQPAPTQPPASEAKPQGKPQAKPAAKGPEPAAAKKTAAAEKKPASGSPAPARAPAPVHAPTPAQASEDGHPAHPAAAHGESPASSSTATTASLVLLAGILGVLAAFWALHGKTQAPAAERLPSTPVELQRFTPRTEATLTLQLRGEAWLAVSVDGKPRFEGNAPQGSRMDWKTSQAVMIRTSDPDALKLTLNGAPIKLPSPDASGTYRIEAP